MHDPTVADAVRDLQETRPSDLMLAGVIKASDRLRAAVDDVAGHLMMAEGHLVKGELAKAHDCLVRARYRLAEVTHR